MAAISPGAPDAVWRKPKAPTATTKLHRYESFTRRIARLKIDPVHKIENRPESNDVSDLSQSHFRNSLEEWAELNLSQTFTSFFNKVNPLSESLPQILHHADQICDLLLQHVEKKDALALESLLSLLAHLAHDLGQSFEKYFSRTVAVVAQVAASHESAEVIEWCFTCLSWMFKYLSRLLVQDLRPLLLIMKPYLSARKDYIARFSAESLAFLLRKAAALYPKRKTPLTLAVTSLLEQAEDDETNRTGVMTLLLESSSGVEGGVHSSAPYLLQSVLDVTAELSFRSSSQSVLDGFLVGTVHRTDKKGFQSLLPVIFENAQVCGVSGDSERICSAVKVLQAVVGTRKGSRISDWQGALQAFITLCAPQVLTQDLQHLRQSILSTSAMLLQYAPLSQLLPIQDSLLEVTTKELHPRDFFAYCTLVADMGVQRFQDLLLPRLQQFIVSRWADDEVGLSFFLENANQSGIMHVESGRSGHIYCPKEWETSILDRLSKADSGGEIIQDDILASFIRLSKNIKFPTTSNTEASFHQILGSLVAQGLNGTSNDFSLRRRLSLGWAFQAYLDLSPRVEGTEHDLWNMILDATPQCFRLAPFVEACCQLSNFEAPKTSTKAKTVENVQNFLIQNLLMGSQSLREASMSLLVALSTDEVAQWLAETVEIASEILQTPYLPSNARQIAMLIRKLPQRQKLCAFHPTMQKVIPYFCLGLLPSYYDQTRKDVCDALGQMMQNSSVEDEVLDVVITWLRSPSLPVNVSKPVDSANKKLSPFECSNLLQARNLSFQAFETYTNASKRMHTLAEGAHLLETVRTPEFGRAIALQVLSETPAIAEKRSRLLIPILLGAQFSKGRQEPLEPSDESVSSHTLSPDIAEHDWSLADRKAFLILLGKFQNPRALFRSAEVHEKLYQLLANGNGEIRKLALLAIMTWKDPVLSRQEKILTQIVEEKSVNADIGTILNAESSENPLQESDRPTVLPVLLRLLFGQIIGRSGIQGSQEARRKSILRMLFRMRESEVVLFLQIALGALGEIRINSNDSEHDILSRDVVPADQQYGFLRMMLSLLEALQSQFAPFGKHIIDAILYCTLRASRQIETQSASLASICRNTRRVGFQCLAILFEHCADFDWGLYVPVLFREAINPRIDSFSVETAQGVSGILRIISIWCHSPRLVRFINRYDTRLPTAVWECLSLPSAKNEVKNFVLEGVAGPLIDLALDESLPFNDASTILKLEADSLLQNLAVALQTAPPKDTLISITTVLTKISLFAKSSETRSVIIDLLVTLLGTSKQRLSPLVKGSILSAIESLIQPGECINTAISDKLYNTGSSLFDYFKDPTNRLTLCQILKKLSGNDKSLIAASALCFDLNAVSSSKLSEIDYDRRLNAFHRVSDLEVNSTTPRMWLPILYNLLFFGRAEDFSIRSNAVSSLRSFISGACASKAPDVEALVRDILLPTLFKRVTEDSEVIRSDNVSLLGLIIQQLENSPELLDMQTLLVENDEEASFFSNILHIQQHRRLRAIRRLHSEVENGTITSANIARFFIPLLQKFIYDKSDDASTQAVKGQSLIAMNTLLQWIEWKQFRAIFRRLKSDLEGDDQNEKSAIKLLGHAADALSRAWAEKYSTTEEVCEGHVSHLAASLPSAEVVINELKAQFIPRLADFVHYKDETQMSFRLPAATTAIKLIKLMPQEEIQALSAPIMLDVAQILRSRTQESRDTARSALSEMVVLLGPGSLHFVLKGLRSALKRGSQLHVLSFTLHSLLVALTPTLQLGQLDYCLPDLTAVIMDDTFGLIGLEKENQDYISTMKEVKSSKSYDSMELLARSASVSDLIRLIEPIQILLTGNLITKHVKKVDELLRRIGIGLSRNPQASSRDLLVFAYQVIKGFYKEKSDLQSRIATNDERNRQRFLVQLSTINKTSIGGNSLLYKIAKFAIDLVRSMLLKHDELLTAENVHGFLPIIGDALIEAQEDVKTSALRLLSAIIKLRMPDIDKNALVYVWEAVKLVKNSTNTNEESAQAALKFVAAVLRERKSVQVRESDIGDLLSRITPDLEEPDRQGVTFNFIKAVMARKYQLPQIYELADKIGIMMVTNHSKGARDVARGVFVHFLLDYIQSSARWTKQQKFLMKNLDYEYPEGRQSVMEATSMLLSKTSGDTAQQIVSTFFIPVVLRMANDDHEECRALAGALLSQIFQKADQSHLKNLLEPLRAWIEQTENVSLAKVSMQAYGVFFDSQRAGTDAEIDHVLDCIGGALQTPILEDNEDWEMRYQALQLLLKLAESLLAAIVSQKQTATWSMIRSLLKHPHPWIQTIAASLVGIFFRTCTATNLSKLPLTSSHGLQWDENALLEVLKGSVKTIKLNEGNTDLNAQVMPNLVFLGRCINMNGLLMQVKNDAKTDMDGTATSDVEDLSDSSNEEEHMTQIPAIQYLLNQASMILRRESPRLTSAALLPKTSTLELLTALLPSLSPTSLTPIIIQSILLPLQHLADTNTITPRSADPTFPAAYQELVVKSHEVMEVIQRKVGDAVYVKAMTAVSRTIRDRRESRRTKRRIERVAEPEKAARDKKRKGDRKRDRKREITQSFQKRRRER